MNHNLSITLLSLILGLSLSACKAVGGGRRTTQFHENIGPEMEEGESKFVPVSKAAEPAPEQLVQGDPPEDLTLLSADPMPQTIAFKPNELSEITQFTLKSMTFGTEGDYVQYRVDLRNSKVAVDRLNEDVWVEKTNKTLSTKESDEIMNLIASAQLIQYPKCSACSEDSHTVILEKKVGDQVQKAYAMQDECLCGEGDERSPNIAYASLRELLGLLR